MPEEDAKFVSEWFTLDEQARPQVFCLRPSSDADESRGQSWWGRKEDKAKGKQALPSVFERLQTVLRAASGVLQDPLRRQLYEISVTQDEVQHGLLSLSSEAERAKVFFFSRKIGASPDPAQDQAVRKFFDVAKDGSELDQDAAARLEQLRQQVQWLPSFFLLPFPCFPMLFPFGFVHRLSISSLPRKFT